MTHYLLIEFILFSRIPNLGDNTLFSEVFPPFFLFYLSEYQDAITSYDSERLILSFLSFVFWNKFFRKIELSPQVQIPRSIGFTIHEEFKNTIFSSLF